MNVLGKPVALISSLPCHPSLLECAGVYFLQSPATGLVKIGRAGHFLSRLGILQGQNPEELVLIGFKPTGRTTDLEKHMHAVLAEYRVRGEWFRVTRDQIGDALGLFR